MDSGDTEFSEAALVVHDHLAQWGGAEYVVDNICRSLNGSLLLGYADPDAQSCLRYAKLVRTGISSAAHKYRDFLLPLFFFSLSECPES